MEINAAPAITSAFGAHRASPGDRVARTAQAAQDFEAMFATQMLAPMWEGIGVDETFGGGHGEEVFRGMMLQEYGKTLAQSNSLGLAKHVQNAMLKLQEA